MKDKVALLTGAAGAIGRGVSEVLLENGSLVAATDLPGERLDGFVEDLDAMAPGRSFGVGMDVTETRSVKEGFDAVFGKFGRLDIVVHNAGIAHVSKIIDMDVEAFRRIEKPMLACSEAEVREDTSKAMRTGQ